MIDPCRQQLGRGGVGNFNQADPIGISNKMILFIVVRREYPASFFVVEHMLMRVDFTLKIGAITTTAAS